MPCTERWYGVLQRAGLWSLLASLGWLSACSSSSRAPAVPPEGGGRVASSASSAPDGGKPAPGATRSPGAGVSASLPPPRAARNHVELRRQAAERLVAANPGKVYLGTVPAVLLAIPVLEIELKADGHIRQVHVLRKPGQAPETLQMAIDAVHRAAPFGDMRHLPQPWKFSETFLFNDERRFKPRTLDE